VLEFAVIIILEMNFSASLRRDLAQRALKFAEANCLPHSLSYGEMPVVCFAPEDKRHGNFIAASYKAILSNPEWRRRLAKIHAQGKKSLPSNDRGRWMELDTCTSSDALLMNIFCYPRLCRGGAFDLPGVTSAAAPHFGVKARVPLLNGRSDQTEVDMRLGDLLIEAKLTESDFQKAAKKVMARYRDFSDVFEDEQLPQTEDCYLSYQLLRNVLAAHALGCSFSVLLDARRPDLLEAWYAVMRCVKPVELRTALRVLTWQELARVMPATLQDFLAAKYGIEAT
jgi:hypothetical protein